MELEILQYIQNIHNVILDHIMVGATYSGSLGAIWILLAIFFILTKKYRLCGITMIISLIMCFLVGNVLLKNIIARSRPCWIDSSVALLIKNPTDYSFPSGHTLASFASAMTIFLYHKKEGIIALIWASLIGFSRLYLFVHYPTDVLGSILLGIAISIIVTLMVKKQINIKLNKVCKIS